MLDLDAGVESKLGEALDGAVSLVTTVLGGVVILSSNPVSFGASTLFAVQFVNYSLISTSFFKLPITVSAFVMITNAAWLHPSSSSTTPMGIIFVFVCR